MVILSFIALTLSFINIFGYRYILKEDRPSKASSWLPRTMIQLTARVELYTDINAKNNGVEKEYIGESGRTFAERFKEHQKPPSPISDHCNTSGHNININKLTIVGREDQNLTRAIKEAIPYKGQ